MNIIWDPGWPSKSNSIKKPAELDTFIAFREADGTGDSHRAVVSNRQRVKPQLCYSPALQCQWTLHDSSIFPKPISSSTSDGPSHLSAHDWSRSAQVTYSSPETTGRNPNGGFKEKRNCLKGYAWYLGSIQEIVSISSKHTLKMSSPKRTKTFLFLENSQNTQCFGIAFS